MAFGSGTFSDIGGAVSDILGGVEKNQGLQIEAQGMRLRAAGSITEAQNYDLASTLASQNEMFTKVSTGIKSMQADRQNYLGIGETAADIGGSGFSTGSGSALDILRSGAAQGALTKQVIGQQGLITEAGYDEQSQAYRNLAVSARNAASVESDMADKQDALGSFSQTAGMITGAIKGAAGIASLFIP